MTKISCPIILLRNLDLGEGLCNGTRMVVLNVRKKVLQYRIISKNKRFRVLIPRIRLSPNTKTLPVPLKRLQFLVRLTFALVCMKAINSFYYCILLFLVFFLVGGKLVN